MSTRCARPRAVWAALVTSVVLCLLIVGGVFLPVLGLIGAADGGTAGALDVPVGSIAAAAAIGYLLALVLLALILVVRNGPLAWVLGVAAVVSTLLVSLWPLVATALAGVDQARDVWPFIQELLQRFS
ncbi:hypothetical protein [Frigoribacterium faeni]|uniref:hypothetical protein n=1 Tax=Frigoribacterium faeni TaxID=145483 RepID=UPI001FB867D3|nr:hypothetical protein [Frigoribacterium faeni]NIJ05012.1 hypothetical protein [Frigoribacterium faeni]